MSRKDVGAVLIWQAADHREARLGYESGADKSSMKLVVDGYKHPRVGVDDLTQTTDHLLMLAIVGGYR